MVTSATYDVVVVGGGTNSLTAAAYVAKAGKNVLVLEKNSRCGGGAVSEEVAPGFIHDTHATGFAGCINSPTLTADELGLYSREGLQFGKWDSFFTSLFDDGSTLTTFRDVDRTCADIARYSSRDAEVYRLFADKCLSLISLLTTGSTNPPLPMASFLGLLERSHLGRELANALFCSAWDVITHYFESPELQAHYFKWIGEAMEHPEAKGTGIAMYNLLGMAHSTDAVFPIGGGQQLSDALVRSIEHFGGTVRTEAEVTGVTIHSGKASGVTLADGESIGARDAVIACIHPWRLGEFIPQLSDELKDELTWVRLSNHGACNQHISLDTEPQFNTDNPEVCRTTMCLELMHRDDPKEMRRAMDRYRFGELPDKDQISPLVMRPSVLDKSRVPEPDYCALYLYQFAPLTDSRGEPLPWDELKSGYADDIWDVFTSYATNIDDSNVLGRLAESPQDHHDHSASMMYGDIFGIGMPGQLLGRRPTPSLANFKIPEIESIYLVGPFMHPGGLVTLGGRTTAIRMYKDLGIDLNAGFEGI